MTSDRRSFLRKAGVAGGVIGGAWVAPTIWASPAGAGPGSVSCVGETPDGFFSWAGGSLGNYTLNTASAPGQRSGSPGSGAEMGAGGWLNHPTYSDAARTTPIPGLTISFTLVGTTFLNTLTNTNQAHGVSNIGISAADWISYRISKTGNPPVGDIMTLIVQFSEPVICPVVPIADVDNNYLAGDVPQQSCSGPPGTGGQAWSDTIIASATSGLNQTGTPRNVTGNLNTPTNVSFDVANQWWRADACASIPQSSNVSDIYFQAEGPTQEVRIDYRSNFLDDTGQGAQHIALGPITFTQT